MRRNPLPRPLRSADLSRVEAVLTDVDGTLTCGDKLESRTLQALERLDHLGLKVVLVSGRPAGWGECWARTLPVGGVIVENGGVTFARDRRGRLRKTYAQRTSERKANRARLLREVTSAIRRVPGARLSSDSAYTEVDIAIDYNEEVKLGPDQVRALQSRLSQRGVTVARSSVHLNCWIGSFDKLSAARRYLSAQWSLRGSKGDSRFIFVGDSLNDAPMFGGFELTVGVANVLDVLESLEHRPAFVTRAREGRGFEEVVDAILRQQDR